MQMNPAILALMIPLLFVIGVIFLGALAITRGGHRREPGGQEEARLMQEIYNGLNRMDQRVESLETLMLEEQQEPKPTL